MRLGRLKQGRGDDLWRTTVTAGSSFGAELDGISAQNHMRWIASNQMQDQKHVHQPVTVFAL